MTSTIRGRCAALALAVGTAVGVGTATAAPTTADTVPVSHCWGPSPNLLDPPFSVSKLAVTPLGPGRAQVAVTEVSSIWVMLAPAYRSTGRLDWHNLNTGRRGVAFNTDVIDYFPGGPVFDITPGTGTVRVTLSAVNRNHFWAVPTTACSGTIRVT